MRALLLLACLGWAPMAHAYLPPAFFIYTQLAESRAKQVASGAVLTVSRPASGGTEEILGTLTVSSWPLSQGGWPTLSLLLASDPHALMAAVREFGLPVAKESELLRVSKEQAAAMKDPPRPFYKNDLSMSLKRYRQTYAWAHGDKASGKSVWVEKDTLLPLRIEAPCPEVNLPWAKEGTVCLVEFRNIFSLRRGNGGGTKIIFSRDGFPVLTYTFEKLLTGPAAAGVPTGYSFSENTKHLDELTAVTSFLLH